MLHAKYSKTSTQSEIQKEAEICLQCGVCCVIKGQSCHAQYDPQFTPKQTYVYDCLSHEDPSKNANIWLCVSCHKCEDLCPYDVSPLHFIDALKEEAFPKGLAPELMTGEFKQVIETGFAFPVTPNTVRLRESLGLKQMQSNLTEDLGSIIGKIRQHSTEKEAKE